METPTESRCPEAMVNLVEDSVPKAWGQSHKMKLKIRENSLGTAEENFKVPAGGQHPGEATNSEYPSPGVLTEVMDVPPIPSSSGLRISCYKLHR